MSAAAGRVAAQAGKAASKKAETEVLNKGAKRDPELYVSSISSLTSGLPCKWPSSLANSYSIMLTYVQVLLGVMAGAFGLAGYYFGKIPTIVSHDRNINWSILIGSKPTSATSESKVNIAPHSMPWQTESARGDSAREQFKYQYHPGGDPKNPPRDAPSALNSVIVPNVNLPKVGPVIIYTSVHGWGVTVEVLLSCLHDIY
jgi:hypothetical protein